MLIELAQYVVECRLLHRIKYSYDTFVQGQDSTQDERTASAIHTVRMDSKLGGKAVQVRVTQGHEPRHFLRIFKGYRIIISALSPY